MELILWRHAEAADASIGEPDLARPLTKRGRKQARRMAGWLLERRPKDLRILVSPAERCQQTAQALGLAYKIEPRLGIGAEAGEILKIVRWPQGLGESGGALLLVGHQPTLGQVAALLMRGAEDDWNVKRGAVWWFSSGNVADGAPTLLRAVIGPEMV